MFVLSKGKSTGKIVNSLSDNGVIISTTHYSVEEYSQGIHWATKRNVLRIGHAGTDPGVRTEMLTDLSKEVGVILFVNTDTGTSVGEQDFRPFFSISDELWKYAQT